MICCIDNGSTRRIRVGSTRAKCDGVAPMIPPICRCRRLAEFENGSSSLWVPRMKQAVGHQECLRHNVAIQGCPRTRNEWREGLGKPRSKSMCGICGCGFGGSRNWERRSLKEGCASATDEETSPPISKIPSDLIWPSSRPRRACRPQPTIDISEKKNQRLHLQPFTHCFRHI